MPDDENSADRLKAHRFKPGVSGNPGGRAKGYERRLHEIVDGEMVDHPLDAKLGKVPAWNAIVLKAIDDALNGAGAVRDRARVFLAGYLMGKPKQNVKIEDVTPRGPTPWDSLPIERRRELLSTFEELGLLDEGPAPDGPTEH